MFLSDFIAYLSLGAPGWLPHLYDTKTIGKYNLSNHLKTHYHETEICISP